LRACNWRREEALFCVGGKERSMYAHSVLAARVAEAGGKRAWWQQVRVGEVAVEQEEQIRAGDGRS
jgi:hypothetical protein